MTDVTTRTATIDLHPNQVVVCTFVNASEQPDAGVSQVANGPFKVDGVYASTALDSQTSKRRNAKRRGVFDFYVMIQNDGGRLDSFKVRGLSTGSTRISVAFLDPNLVTSQVTAGTYTVSNLAPGATAFLGIRFTVGPRASSGARKTVDVTVSSVLDPTRVDVVRAVTRR